MAAPSTLTTTCWALLALAAGVGASCPADQLVTYRLDIDTRWSQRRFPKHYPLWRPPAQFSKFFGMSHNSSRVLFRAGELASEAVRQFAEAGSATGLEVITQGHTGVLDQFTTAPIRRGEGSAHARLFVDGTHSQVSLMSKIVPSPDWFIGIDSVDLCESGRWIDSLDVKLFPMDAGTDQGMTFTSPNWESDPHEPICQITSRKPSHPASSFHYRHQAALPAIAGLRLARVRSYTLSDEFDQTNTVTYTVDALGSSRVLSMPSSPSSLGQPGLRVFGTTSTNRSSTRAPTFPSRGAETTASQVALSSAKASAKVALASPRRANDISQWPRSKQAEVVQRTAATPLLPRSKQAEVALRPVSKLSQAPLRPAQRTAAAPPHGGGGVPDRSTAYEVLRADGEAARAALRPDGSVARVALRPDGSVARVALRPDGVPVRIGGLRVWAVNSGGGDGGGGGGVEGAKVRAGDRKAIIRKIADHYRRRSGRHRRRRLRRRKRKRVPRDCSVGAWSEWGSCSRACGIGETTRRRQVAQHARRGGRPCPALVQRRWCGSARACSSRKQYFRW